MFSGINTKMMGDNMEFVYDELPKVSILVIFLFAIFLFLSRLFFRLILIITSKIYFRKKLANKKIRKTPNLAIFKREEPLLRDMNKEKRKNNNFSIEFIDNQIDQKLIDDIEKLNQIEENAENDSKIVGIVKPMGFWTSLVLGDQLTEVLSKAKTLSNRSKKSFWISMLETQSKMNLKKNKINALD